MKLLLILLVAMILIVTSSGHRHRPRSRASGGNSGGGSSGGDREESVCRWANKRALDLEKYDKHRQERGYDVSIADMTEINPALLSGKDGKSELAATLKDLTILCKVIKSVNKKRYSSDNISLTDILDSRKKSCKDFECPFVEPEDCTNAATMKYRKADGSCNNIANPLWGSSNIPFIRKLDPQYDDGCGSPRTKDLPGPRQISEAFHTLTMNPPVTTVSTLYTSFGQFVSHDMSHTPMEKGYNGIPLNCCSRKPNGDPRPHRSKCLNIDIDANDSFFSQRPCKCMPFKRSVPSVDLDCESCTRQQLNVVTSFIDLSTVYGDTKDYSDSLRILDSDNTKRGQLKTSGDDLFPLDSHQNPISRDNGFHPFKAGDKKINEHHGLFASTILFFRHHNKIAKALSTLNPHWPDETVFQESRRVNIAILQHIVYDEYLHETLRDSTMNSEGLRSQTGQNFDTGYDAAVDPTIMNVFGAAAMRFGHSMLNDVNKFADRNLNVNADPQPLDQSFFRPFTYLCREMDINRGQLVSASEDCDRFFVSSVRDKLFRTSPLNGLDLTSLNIQRGRDHGLPPYHEWRSEYSLAGSIGSFPDHLAPDAIILNTLYSVASRGVDMFTGMVSEKVITNRPVGPLVAAILAEQFKKAKQGDRFWYETNQSPQAFTGGQLEKIRSVTMAMMLCNCYDLHDIQQQPFLIYDGATNPKVLCSTFTDIDLSLWTETPP